MLQKLARYATFLAILTPMLAAALGSIGSAAAAEADGTPQPGTPPTTQQPSVSTFVLEHFYSGRDGAAKEFAAARNDHAAIALDIGQCYRDKFGDPLRWSPSVKAILLFELDENLMHKVLTVDDPSGKEYGTRELPVLNSFHAAAISFSDRISRDRLGFRRELEENLTHSYWYQILILGLGAGTTIFVSARSIMQGNTVMSGVVGILAIVLSAAGTAVSSMNAFEGSRAIVLRDQRALSQLQQLHWRVASDVLKQHAICNDPAQLPDKTMDMVDAWRSRLETILDSAVDSISKPGDLTNGGVVDQAAGKNGQANTVTAGR